AMDQAAFVRLLRITLRSCVDNGNLLAALRSVQFHVNQDSKVTLKHGQDTMGRNIDAQAMTEAGIPEDLVFGVRVFDAMPIAAAIACAIEIFPQDQKFKLPPFPLEVFRAYEAALEWFGNEMEAVQIRHYRGAP